MHITRRKELTVRMGEYESFKFSAEVGVTHRDFGISDDEAHRSQEAAQSMRDFVSEQLDLSLQADIDDAVELTQDRNSFLAAALRPPPLARSRTATRRTR